MGALADLLAEELRSKETKWPKGALSFEEVQRVRKDAGVACGECSTHKFIQTAREAGRVEVVRGVTLKGTRYVRAVRYLFK